MYTEQRRRLVDWVRLQLTGDSRSGDARTLPDEIRGVLPTERFPCGALYPVSSDGEGMDPATADEIETEPSGDETPKTNAEPCVVRRYIPPSSMGFSFYVEGSDIRFQVLCAACRYERRERDERGRFINEWTQILLPEEVEIFPKQQAQPPRQQLPVLGRLAAVDVLWRPFGVGWIVTVTLCNTQEMEEKSKDYAAGRAEKTLFAANLRCVMESGEIGVYPRVDRALLDAEEQEIELQYANRRIYAIGHGCAVDWEEREGRIHTLRADPMPVVEVPQVTADTGADGDPALSLARLSQNDEWHAGTGRELAGFIDGYGNWVLARGDAANRLPTEDRETGKRIVDRMKAAISRMRAGLALLEKDRNVQKSFALANRAMLDQMRQHDLVSGNERPLESYRWRPFQLAFLLTVLESAVNEESDFRDTVDLIWFPTGGGKTEAYLGLIAFLIVLRRLRFPAASGGTAVLMRYTLRLLTRDQFLRATRLICALERIRRERDDLGDEPISIGMWVGNASSPNTFQAANDAIIKARQTGGKPSLVIDRCPWCGKAFAIDDYRADLTRFQFRCRNPECAFGAAQDGILPCNVVDEALYEQPPTLLIATLDKFARLTWEERTNAFFGGKAHRPPELIIQDELHLIAGALGSVAGLYEAALDTVLRSRGMYPKYIASTATIRMAAEQVRRLYGREVAVFPPPGLDCDDSFFARTVPLSVRPGRMYVGYFSPMQNRQQCLAPLAAALLLAPLALFGEEKDADDLLDAWWTQVVYHGSLKGVGNSHTVFEHDAREFMRLLLEPPAAEERQENPAARKRPIIAQLTSQQTAEENAAIFAQLKKGREDADCLDAALATNMVSVGLDVARLALMVINGQPLTTAEYIQASSRVGRGEVPGIVFANYYRDQARSLSHYEGFRSYHDAFYRFVEPTSVTPYTYQARARALHAALVIAVRHSCADLLGNGTAGSFNTEAPNVARVIELLARRCEESAPKDQEKEITEHLRRLAEEWKTEAARCRENRRALDYQVPDNDTGRDRLLYAHDAKIPGLWPTLNSMRNIENMALFKVL
ncbi:MAG: helicase [Candidatus Accumulibacter sp.]|jgi:hypothetical protein|nr:helicase [Accumulibacter sp.]